MKKIVPFTWASRWLMFMNLLKGPSEFAPGFLNITEIRTMIKKAERMSIAD